MTNSIRKLIEEKEALRKLFEPPGCIVKMIEEQKALHKLFEPPAYIQKMVEEQNPLWKLLEPPEYIQRMVEEQKTFQKFFEPPEYIQKMVEEQNALRKLFEPPEYIRKMVEEQAKFKEMFAPSGAIASALQSLINQNIYPEPDIAEKIQGVAKYLSVDELHMNSDGSLSLDGQAIGFSELGTSVGNFFEEISKNFSTENILYQLSCLQAPAKRIAIWILNNIIVAFFVNLMASIYAPDIQNLLNSRELNSKREITHAIKKLPPEIDLNEYRNYRVVSAKVLNIRQKPNMQSSVITKLDIGKLVCVIRKKKNWTKVEVEDANSTDTVVGWVATRYIVPLKR